MSNPVKAIKVKGLREFQAAVDKAESGADEALRLVLGTAAEQVATRARRGVPTRSGKARGSIKATVSRMESTVSGGGRRSPYFGWLDYGGRVGRGGSIRRAWRPEGRYLYPAAKAERSYVLATLEASLVDLARDSGLEVH